MKIKINAPQNTSQLKLSPKPAPEPEEIIPEQQYEPEPQYTEPQYEPEPIPEPEPEPIQRTETFPVPDIEPEEKEEIPDKRKKKHKKNKKHKKKQKDGKPLTVEQEYRNYKARKVGVYICMVTLTVFIIAFGIFNIFFRHTLTAEEAATYTNAVNNQGTSQSWDSGVQSFLQRNLKTLMKANFQSDGIVKDFSVSNISVEKNQPFGNNIFLTYFSADVTANSKVAREYGCIFISVADNKFKALSGVNYTTRQPYSFDGTVEETNPLMELANEDIDQKASNEFKITLENFLTLGYNSKKDVSDIYKGKTPLVFEGEFKSIEKCLVYKVPNKLGYNVKAVYTIKMPNGIEYRNTSYMKIEKNSSDSYVIDMIL